MPALDTVNDYIATARVLLQDSVDPYRYADTELVAALNFALLEMRRLRPDLFIGRSNAVPTYTLNSPSKVAVNEQYRMAVLYYIVGHAQLRDDEATQDQRAAAMLTAFRTALTAAT